MGYAGAGQLGHGDRETLCAPRQVEAGRFGGEKVVLVEAGENHTVAVTAGERLYTWGSGVDGQLGHGDTGDRLVPTLVGGHLGKVLPLNSTPAPKTPHRPHPYTGS